MATANVELEKTYRRRFDATAEYRNKVWEVLVKAFFHRYVGQSVLDLGCGYGQFVNSVQCAQRYAMDLNPVARSYLKKGIVFLEQDCSNSWPLEANSLDLIFTSNFFEHLPSKDHLTSTLKEAYRCLRPCGRLVAMGPNIRYAPELYWDFFDHHIALSDHSLREALELVDFRVTAVVPRFLPYTMINQPKYPVQLLSFYLKMPWLWRWFGKQFLVVAEKP